MGLVKKPVLRLCLIVVTVHFLRERLRDPPRRKKTEAVASLLSFKGASGSQGTLYGLKKHLRRPASHKTIIHLSLHGK